MTHKPFLRSIGGEAKKRGDYAFNVQDNVIELGFKSYESPYVSDATGFHEGLWHFDCGELFLLQPATGRYLEINLAPNGAWWSCVFTDVRQRAADIMPPQVEVWSDSVTEAGWSAGFRLPMVEVERCLGSSKGLSGNITLILGGCPDRQVTLENLHSVAKLGAVDFHQPHEWLTLSDLQT